MKNTLAKNAVFNIFYRILNVLFPLITATYVSRILEPAGIGKVAYAQNIVSYFVMFAVLGIPRYGTREIAKSRNNQMAVNRLFTEILIINTISTAVCAVGYYSAVLFGLVGSSIIYLICGLEILFNFISIDWLFEGEEEYAFITTRSILVKLLSLAALFTFVNDEQDYPIYALITCLGLGCNYLFNVFHARKRVNLIFCDLNLRRHLKPIMILALSVVASSLYSRVNVTMLGWLCTEENVGYYTNAHKVVNMILTLVTAVSGVFMPRLSYYYQNDSKKYRQLITAGVKIILFLAIPCCAGLAMVAEDAVTLLFGESFRKSVAAVQVMAVLIVVIGVGDMLCYQAIISSGNEKLLIRSRVYAGIANVILSLLLIPRLQHVGAAIAALVSEVIVNGVLLKDALRIVKPNVGLPYVAKVLLGTLVMAMVVLVIQHCIANVLLSLIISACGGVLVYFVFEKIRRNDIVSLLQQLKHMA